MRKDGSGVNEPTRNLGRNGKPLLELGGTLLSFLPAALWMGVIFRLSAQPAAESSRLSMGLVETIVRGLGNLAPKADPYVLEDALRTLAHFGAYALLGLLIALPALSLAAGRRADEGKGEKEEKEKERKTERRRTAAWTALAGLLYALSDEIHQLFVPGRSFQLQDLLVDAAGLLLGIVLAAGFRKRIRRRKT